MKNPQSSRIALIMGVGAVFAPLILATPTARAADSYGGNPPPSYYVSAPVVDVEPIYFNRTIREPVQQCSTAREEYYDRSYRSSDYYDDSHHHSANTFFPGLLGGIVGGLVGNQFGGGNGKKAMTVVGALAGASIARDAAASRSNHHRSHYRAPSRVCRTTYESRVIEEISAYDVTYEYGGQLFSRRMSEHPGESLRVRVELTPDFTTGEL